MSSSSSVAPSQLSRSARPSNGDAEPCTPLSPTFGSEARPSDSHSLRMLERMEPPSAVAGSVAPSTRERKSAQLRSAAAQLTEK